MIDDVTNKVKFLLSSIYHVYPSQLELMGDGFAVERSVIKLPHLWEGVVVPALMSQASRIVSGYGFKSTLTQAITVHEGDFYGVSSKLLLVNSSLLHNLFLGEEEVVIDSNTGYAGNFWDLKVVVSNFIPDNTFILFPSNIGVSVEQDKDNVLLTLAWKEIYVPIVFGCINDDVEVIDKRGSN